MKLGLWSSCLLALVIAAIGADTHLVGIANGVPSWPGTMAVNLTETAATISLSGPDGAWFAVGFGGVMVNSYSIIVNGDGSVMEQKLGFHTGGHSLSNSVKVLSSEVNSGLRTVVLTRDLLGATSEHYSFDLARHRIPIIFAGSKSKQRISFHDYKGWSSIAFKVDKDPDTSCCSTRRFLPCGFGILGRPIGVTTSAGRYCCPKVGAWYNPCVSPSPVPSPTPTPMPVPTPVPEPAPTPTPGSATWICTVCGHTYDPVADGSGAAFKDLADDWACPVCGVPKAMYKKHASAGEIML